MGTSKLVCPKLVCQCQKQSVSTPACNQDSSNIDENQENYIRPIESTFHCFQWAGFNMDNFVLILFAFLVASKLNFLL